MKHTHTMNQATRISKNDPEEFCGLSAICNQTPTLEISLEVLGEILKTIGSLHAEQGGALGGLETSDEVNHFHFDNTSNQSSVTYSPDHRFLNRLFKKEWNPKGIRLRGFVHSHPGRGSSPSHGDEIYAKNILQAIPDLEILWLPIVNTVPDTGEFFFTPWAAVVHAGELRLIRGEVTVTEYSAEMRRKLSKGWILPDFAKGECLEEIRICKSQKAPATGKLHKLSSLFRKLKRGNEEVGLPVPTLCFSPHRAPRRWGFRRRKAEETFQRVENAYDLSLMSASRVVAVGAGGAAEWLEELARAGLGQFVLIDPDTVSETNLATQQTYRRDLGRPKVNCIAERILDINPNAKVIALRKSLDDFDDDAVEALSLHAIDGTVPQRTVIAGLTDDFFAQARVNRLALQLSLPSLSAQVYLEGRGAEVTFTFPGVTPACHRCILSSRYDYFLKKGKENDVTSHGTPIFSTTRLNSIKGFVMLALLHHGSSHPRWGSMLKRIGNRNLAVVRMDPDFSETVGMRTFDRVFEGADRERIFFDEVLWLPQRPECPENGHESCPDCGGSGDLRTVKGKIRDTAIARPEQPKPSF